MVVYPRRGGVQMGQLARKRLISILAGSLERGRLGLPDDADLVALRDESGRQDGAKWSAAGRATSGAGVGRLALLDVDVQTVRGDRRDEKVALRKAVSRGMRRA